MTKEPIMINDVDVSGCDFLAKEDDYCSYSGEYRAYKGQCGCSDEEMCKDHPNCFYKKSLKQLKDKEQECEELKKKLKPKLKNAHCTYFEGQTGLCKAKEFTRCNPVGCKLYTIDELSTIVDLQQQLDQLKSKMTAQEIDQSTYIKQLEKTINRIRAERDDYKQSLQKIKQIAKDDCKTCTVKLLGEDEINCKRCYKTKILQKYEVIKDETKN